MASTLSHYLMCPVCLSDFRDPVSLPCEHNFCRQCITNNLESSTGSNKCPECRQIFIKQDLKGNRVLRNLVEALQQQSQAKEVVKVQQLTPRNAHEMLCSEHEEQLKLFCEDDQRLVCLICKDGEKHHGHSFKPVKEVMKTSENAVREALSFISDENKQVGDLILSQTVKMTNSKKRAKSLEEKIHAQFKKMHDFLWEKEERIMKQLQRTVSSAEVPVKQNASLLAEMQINENIQVSVLESGLKISQPSVVE